MPNQRRAGTIFLTMVFGGFNKKLNGRSLVPYHNPAGYLILEQTYVEQVEAKKNGLVKRIKKQFDTRQRPARERLAFMLKKSCYQEITIQKIIFEEKRNGKRI